MLCIFILFYFILCYLYLFYFILSMRTLSLSLSVSISVSMHDDAGIKLHLILFFPSSLSLFTPSGGALSFEEIAVALDLDGKYGY